jgi:para-nitrobenzyl esterase
VEQVRQASRMLSGTLPPPGQVHTPANLVWQPTADGQVVSEDLCCWPADVPVLFDWNEDEARFFITPTGPYGARGVDPAQIYTPNTLAKMAKTLGRQRADDSYRRFTNLGRTAYAYRFARVSPGNRRTGMLAYHSAELPYVFGRLTPAEQYDEVDAHVSDIVQHAWTEFARTGVPRSADGTPWPACTATRPQLTVIDDSTHSRPLDNNPVIELISSTRTDANHR